MKWKNRLTNYNFWVSIVSAVLLILQSFNVKFDISNFNEITTGVLGLLVVIGIINDPTKTSESTTKKDLLTDKTNNSQMENLENKLLDEIKNITSVKQEGQESAKAEEKNTSEQISETLQEKVCADEKVSLNTDSESIIKNAQTDITNEGMPIIVKDEDDFGIDKTTDKIFIEEECSKLEEDSLKIDLNLQEADSQNTIEVTNENQEDVKIIESEEGELQNKVEIESKTENDFAKCEGQLNSFNIVN